MRFAGELLNGQPAEATVAYNPDGYFNELSPEELMYKRQQLQMEQNPAPRINSSDIKLPQDDIPPAQWGGTVFDQQLMKDRFLLQSPNSPLA